MKTQHLYRTVLKPLPVGFLPAVKPSWGARASTCAGVTEVDDADGLADGVAGVPGFMVVGVTDDDDAEAVAGPVFLIVGVTDDDGTEGLVDWAG